ncbi:MAG: GGDEF domain-containing phosphodiesterase [Rickettsiales bacterium]|nr:GGDEF domain-containing phosphodiesterase [Rickettsiales bacterium]
MSAKDSEHAQGLAVMTDNATQEQANGQGNEFDRMTSASYPERFVTLLQDAIAESQTSNKPGALLVISIENLAMIMSGHGHDTSEKVMQQIKHEVCEIVGHSDSVNRIQRDQLGIVLKNAEAKEVQYLSERIVSHIQHFSCYADIGSLHITSSIAHIMFPEQCSTAEDALDKSFIALREGTGSYIRQLDESQDLSATSRQEMALANYLSKAIREDRLQMAYQPIISSKDGAISHYEALLRMRTDEGKITSAGALVPIAERMGLIDKIDDFTLARVVKELRAHDSVKLAFNVSNITTQNPKWLEDFQYYMKETPEIAPRCIVEITETAAQLDLSQTAYFVAEIQAHGCLVALDDFGSGYTSFRQLKSLSVDLVKIDGAFIKDLVDNYDNRFFVKTLLDFTKGFGLEAVAEFVETGDIAKVLMDLGVEYQQGYYFGRPENHRSWLDSGEYSSS